MTTSQIVVLHVTLVCSFQNSKSRRILVSSHCCLGGRGCLFFLGFLRPWCHASVTLGAGRSICFGMSSRKLQSKFLPQLQLMEKLLLDKTSGSCINTETAEHSQQIAVLESTGAL